MLFDFGCSQVAADLKHNEPDMMGDRFQITE